MLQVDEVVLVDEVIHLLVHAFDNMISHDVLAIRNPLYLSFFHVLIEVPNQNGYDVFFIILCDYLKDVLLDGFDETNDFCIS